MISEQAARAIDLVNGIETCKQQDEGLWRGMITRLIMDLGETGSWSALQAVTALLSDVWGRLPDRDFTEETRNPPYARAVIVVLPRFFDGYIAHWYRSTDDADREGGSAVLSVTAKGVLVGAAMYLDDIAPEWLADARRASRLLGDGKTAEVKKMATHRYRRGLLGPLTEIAP